MSHLLLFSEATGAIVGSLITADGEDVPIAGDGYCYVAVSADEWEYVQSVNVSALAYPCHWPSLVLSPTKQRTDHSLNPASHAEVLQLHGFYQANRRDAYDPLAEQVGRITKALAKLAADGIDIGEHGAEQVNHCRDIKERFPSL